jgi:hypothetical protein
MVLKGLKNEKRNTVTHWLYTWIVSFIRGFDRRHFLIYGPFAEPYGAAQMPPTAERRNRPTGSRVDIISKEVKQRPLACCCSSFTLLIGEWNSSIKSIFLVDIIKIDRPPCHDLLAWPPACRSTIPGSWFWKGARERNIDFIFILLVDDRI